MEQSKICRLCLSTEDVITDVFVETEEKSELQTKIWTCFRFWVHKEDSLPKSICKQCSATVEHFNSFLKKVLIAQHVLKTTFDKDVNVKNGINLQNSPVIQTILQNDSSTLQLQDKHSVQPRQDVNTKIRKSKTKSKLYKALTKPKAKAKQKTLSVSDDSGSDNSILFFNKNIDSDDDNENLLPEELLNGIPSLKLRKEFPRTILDDCKLLVRGKRLIALLSKFYKLVCNLCPEKPTFKRLQEMCLHFTETHKLKGYVECCGGQFIKPQAMAMHMARHLQPDAFTCQTCGKLMTCPRILQYHQQNHLPEAERPLVCPQPQCPRRFSYRSALLTHQISHLPESEREAHVCDECGKTFFTPGRLSTHVNIAHAQKSPSTIFVCHICAKPFTVSTNLMYHLTTHQPKETNQVQCDQCGNWYKNKLCLKKHMVQHGSTKQHCQLCAYTCMTSRGIKHHVKMKHSDCKPYVCDVCDKAFKMKSNLQAHMAQHTGERRYECQFCSRTFASSGNFYSHRKKMHAAQLQALKDEKQLKEEQWRLSKMDGQFQESTTS